MPSTLYDTELWREYAGQMRALSKKMADPQMKRRVLSAADGFERIADLAAQLRLAAERRKRWGWAA